MNHYNDVQSENGEGSQTGTQDVNQFSPTFLSSPSMQSSDFVDARPILPIASFFMGDLRDGLAMVSAFFVKRNTIRLCYFPQPFSTNRIAILFIISR